MHVKIRNNLGPHQIDLIKSILSLGHGDRLLLIGPPGTGKTTALSASISGFIRERSTGVHVLVVAPHGLAQYLTPILRDVIGENVLFVNAPEYRRLQTVTAAGENPWAAVPVIVTSLDFSKADDRLKALLEVQWDAVFIDEDGLGDIESFRTRLIQTLWNSSAVGIAVAMSDGEVPKLASNIPSLKTVRWTPQRIGLVYSSHRTIKPVEYVLTDPEQEFAKHFLNTLANIKGHGPQSDMMISLFRARLASSLLSAEQTLRHYENALGEQRVGSLDFTANPEGAETQEVTNDLLTAEDYRRLLELFESIEVDSKWRSCGKLLRSLINDRHDRSVVIFTSFVSTSYYVASLVGELGVPVYTIRGSLEPDAITKTLELAEAHPGILVTTHLPLQGFELNFTNQVIHYDIPQSPKVLTLRFSRFIPRQEGESISHYFLLDGITATKEDLTKAIEDVLKIERGWEERGS